MADRLSLSIPRDLLEKYFENDPRLIAALEDQSLAVAEAVAIVDGTVSATESLQDATVITLSSNAVLNNEFVLGNGDGTERDIQPGTITISVDKTVARTDGNTVKFVPPAGVILFLPADGTLLSDISAITVKNKTYDKPKLSGLVDANGDSSAAAGGVPVGGMYRDGTTLKVRVV